MTDRTGIGGGFDQNVDVAGEETPILAALTRAAHRIEVPLFVPGHKQGRLLPAALSLWIGAAAKLDLTELPGLDNLHQAEGCILASEALAASHYGADWCLYSVNGSTAGVMAAMMACAAGGRVLMAGAFHQSAWRGLVLAGAEPVMVSGRWDASRRVVRPPDVAEVERALAADPHIRAVYVTSPTYAGVCAPVAELAQLAHRRGIPLIVDEAHGAHFGLHPDLPAHSIRAGADVVIQSVHKMLPGLTQTAWVLGRGGRAPRARVEEALSMVQSTSPSYLLLASLDAAQAWLRHEGAAAAARAIGAVATLWEVYPGQRLDDPLRHFVPMPGMGASRRLQAHLQDAGVWVEYADPLGVLSLFGLAADERMVRRYLEALCNGLDDVRRTASQADDGPGRGKETPGDSALTALIGQGQVRLCAAPREVQFAAREWLPPEEAVGRVAAGLVTPYPPGVPVLLPGQWIEGPVAEALSAWLATGYSVHGVDELGRIPVLRERGPSGVHHV
ncbi:aminotransferase class I/II-fold pyridoxal phosphate-dependent enzyme [Alicyclobacillus sp.]|uniref:aminotransferase class I/II-fold pyridoxal phosphate-dependent enzyme n=1 Tax=Alicyclobacillus sp. TaxID=61169 RepID=UPI0025C3C2D2|nr:aminotransferase class I/II-fold pyridoxal phosphate-dependent enzyme [Alicyclobacillus sp.]MCL6516609.1 aminotransferase class I/II-fold pyridoxal phosphate-dependent enzyme [Alicyclobacillus sp.]